MYKIFQQIGVEAILITSQELRDIDQYFIKRLQSPILHVLSNVTPKEKNSPYAKVKPYFEKDIPGMGKLYVLNLLSADDLKYADIAKNHYDVAEPEDFLRDFLKNINANDVVVARVMMYQTDKIKDLINSSVAKRIDFFIVPPNMVTEYLTDEEKELTKRPYGWVPSPKKTEEKKEPEPQPEPVQPKQPSSGFVGPEAPPSSGSGGEGISSDTGKTEGAGSTEPSANQGGEKTDESASGSQKIITGEGNQTTTGAPDPTGLHLDPRQPPQNPLPKQDIELNVEKREYMEITNKYRVVPMINTAEGMREVHFKRSRNGSSIRVSDIVIYENTPEDPAIKKLADETEQQTRIMREKEILLRTITNTPNNIMYSKMNPYAGPESCKECHEIAYNKWKSSAHARALESLKRKHKEKNEECLKCHLTEWVQPNMWHMEWTFEKFAPELGCESCHGPSQGHINMIRMMMQSNNRQYWKDIKEQVKYLLTEGPLSKNVCLKCHDQANSPDFDFVKYWDMISHDEPEVDELPVAKVSEQPAFTNTGSTTSGQIVTPISPSAKDDKEQKKDKGKEKPKQSSSNKKSK